MIELPEAMTLGAQISSTLSGRTISKAYPPSSPHKFTFFNGEALAYSDLLEGKKITSALDQGIFVDLILDQDTTISINDGVNVRYLPLADAPAKYQLLLEFTDKTSLIFTVAMYGCIFAYQGELENKYYKKSVESISPLNDDFDENYFRELITQEQKNISAKALLATEQRIPGVGNGVLQDILFNTKIHPKRKILSFSEKEKTALFRSLKTTLQAMTTCGGRDTETDLFGNKGGYKTILSKNTYKKPCPKCKEAIVKEAYMGGAIYYCPSCQPL